MTNNLLSIAEIEQHAFLELVERSANIGRQDGLPADLLRGQSIGLLFRKTSTRTRVSFAAAAARLGATPILIGPNDLQTNTGETIADTMRVLGGFLAALVVRTAADPDELRAMAGWGLPIVNAMTSDEHPSQAISDLAMISRQFGRLAGINLLYVGEGNNTAASLALAVARIKGMRIVLHTPPGYALDAAILARARQLAQDFGGGVEERNEPPAPGAAERYHALYATRWQTTGTEKADPDWRRHFAPYRVDTAMLDRLGIGGQAVFMHDLPTNRDEDCESALLDGPRSIAFAQARQKLFTAMAVLEWCATPG